MAVQTEREPQTVGELIRFWRTQRRLTQMELALDANLSTKHLSFVEHTTPQAVNGVLATLEREALIERRPHPTHGRILQATLTSEGQRRLDAANPSIRALHRTIERDLSSDEIATLKAWLVAAAQRLERATESRAA